MRFNIDLLINGMDHEKDLEIFYNSANEHFYINIYYSNSFTNKYPKLSS